MAINGYLLIFWSKFGNVPITCNIVEGIAESWVEAEMSCVEVDGAVWSWVEMDGAGWRWVQGLVIPFFST